MFFTIIAYITTGNVLTAEKVSPLLFHFAIVDITINKSILKMTEKNCLGCLLQVFVCTTIYQNIGMVLNIDFPKGLAQLGIFLITISRFQNFLLLEEFKASGPPQLKSNQKSSISLRNVSVDLSKNPVLSNVTLKFGSSSGLVAIVGSVGSGKVCVCSHFGWKVRFY